MRITLINPPYFERCVREFRCQGIAKITRLLPPEILPPLSLAYIAAVLRDHGYNVEIVDSIALNLTLNDLIKKLSKADLFVFVVSTPTFMTDLNTIEEVKKCFPDIKNCLFGTHVSTFPEETLKKDFVDFAVVGEGEITILELANALEKGQSLSKVKGLAYKKDGIKINSKRPLIEDLDSLPFPARDLLPMERYKPFFYKKLPFTTMLTSRGCPFSCIYCSSRVIFNRKWRSRSPENVVEEIEEVVDKFGIKEIFFNDDLFTLDKKRVQKICDLILENDLDIVWGCESRADTVDHKTLKLMKESGCYKIFYGIESGSQHILDKTKKDIKIDQIEETFKKTKEVGIQCNGSFIIGVPWETKETVKQTIEFAKKLDPDYVNFSIATPYPGTEFYEMVKEKGYLPTEDWNLFDEHLGAAIRSDGLTPKEIEDSVRMAYRHFYLRPSYIVRKLLKIKTFHELRYYLGAAVYLIWYVSFQHRKDQTHLSKLQS
ncbi:MAG: radical SAM protein [Methanocellales archaeon]|nr:radical SAM protein [Methanocellales archaeon]